MSAESPRHARSGGPLTVPSQPPSDRSIIDAVSGFINDVTLSSSSTVDPKDIIQWARFETADINEPTPEGDSDNDISPLLLILGYGSGVQVWLIPPTGEAQEVLSWRQGTVRVLRILPTPQRDDSFAAKRPLIALCDSVSPGPTFCALSFISIRGGEQVKSIKFKNPVLDVLANKRSIVVSFSERFAVFNAATLEDRMTVTTCYPCPCPLGGSMPINPLTLGDRWVAYADKKLNPSKRSSGGCEGEGVTSYTATVLHAAKSLSKGLRGLGESVAHSLAGGRSTSQSPSPPNADIQQPGVVTILDIESNSEDDGQDTEEPYDPIVAHFIAHSEAIIALQFDASGMLLVTADRRGHDFHVFRINPHPCGPSLASVHHLYILHRGDTTAKVQDIAISADSRWAAVSTLRGTTHVFAISPYGGVCGVRTHTQPRVVNRLSRFHRSAGLPIHAAAPARSGSPVGDGLSQGAWFPNPRLPPYPLPFTAQPLAQLRPTANLPTHTITRTSAGRQRLSSLSEECNSAPLLARARFGLAPPPPVAPSRAPAHTALYLMAANGCLLHLVLHPRPARNVAKEKICDDSPIELQVEPIAQWPLQRPPAACDLLAPLPPSNPLLQPLSCRRCADIFMSEEERWLSQVEIVTHAGPHRRLWMGPQFVFKTYNCTGSSSSLSEAEAVEVDTSAARGVARSNPVNMPGARPIVPVLIDSGSASSLEHSPSDSFRRKSLLAESGRAASVCDVQLREDLAEAMKEDHGWPLEVSREEPRRGAGVVRAVDPLGTVVVPPAAPDPVMDDADLYTHSNSDEGTFRPVVRAPATLSLRPDMVVRPLPRDTTIPVQNVSPLTKFTPEREPLPLNTDVVIPAALTDVRYTHATDTDKIDASIKSEVDPSASAAQPAVQKSEEHETRHKTTERAKPVVVEDSTKVDKLNIDIKKTDVNKDLKRRERESGKRDSVHERVKEVDTTERENGNIKTLPENTRVSDDIQPTARVRVKKSPTLKSVSDKEVSDVSVKDNKHKEVRESKKHKEAKEMKEPKETVVVKEFSDIKEAKEAKESKELRKDKEAQGRIEFEQTKYPEVKDRKKESCKKEAVAVINDEPSIEIETRNIIDKDDDKKEVSKKGIITVVKNELSGAVTLKLQTKKESSDTKSKNREILEIKTEEQAWDMLLSEPAKPAILHVSNTPAGNDIIREDFAVSDIIAEDIKPKPRRCRRYKKGRDDNQIKTDDDSFVEIHTIEEKNQPSCGELVSISTTYEDVESSSSYFSKTKKSRSPKSITPERRDEPEKKTIDLLTKLETETFSSMEFRSPKKSDDSSDDIEVLPDPSPDPKPKQTFKVNIESDKIKTHHIDGTSSESASFIAKESLKGKKSKSLSPYPELTRKIAEKTADTERKDVYVINTTKEDFPEIQITRGSNARKRSPQPIERMSLEKEPVIEKPIKSWSSIAATKSVKKVEEVEKKVEPVEKKIETRNVSIDDSPKSSTTYLQEKLSEYCNRTDIMIAECDAPSELHFVEEHHAVVQDLPPLDCGLDDFKLEVMRDSLLDANEAKQTSPICKINIDDILSSIKDTTMKAVESSTFNLVDVETVPMTKERGFSVVESHKITTQEVKLYDEGKSDDRDLEKSSDDDIASPILSADSDKEDKKYTGASNIVTPSSKQLAKPKRSRKKKK